jgi:dipeptidase
MRPLHNWADGYPRVVNAARSPEYAPVGDQEETPVLAYIPQVSETYAYWDLDYGVQNEVGLSMGESTSTAKTVGWPATPDKPYGFCHIGIEDLSKIALERCATARCAVTTMGDIAVEYGFFSADSATPENPGYSGSSEALVLADATAELWIFNVMTGRHNASAIWAAQRVPSNHVVAVGNTFTIRKMNLSDSDNFLYSPGITDLAEEMDWWRPSDDEPGVFDFFRAYGFTPSANDHSTRMGGLIKDILSFYSGRRMWRIFSLLSPDEGAKLDPNKGNLPDTPEPYPGSVPAPHGSITPQQVMEVLRDHYEGTPYDLTAGMAAGPFGSPNRGPVPEVPVPGVWERAISMHRTSWSYVCEARPTLGGVTWLGLDAPHGSPYLPFYGAAAVSAPESFRSHVGTQSHFSTEAAYWAFNMVNQYSDLNFRLINGEARSKARDLDMQGAALVQSCDSQAVGASNPELAAAECSNAFVTQSVAHWWDFAFSLFAKYGRYAVTYSETNETLQKYPEWWLRSPEVGYSFWSIFGPMTARHELTLATESTSVVESQASHVWSAFFAVFLATFTGAVGYHTGARRGNSAKALDTYMHLPA